MLNRLHNIRRFLLQIYAKKNRCHLLIVRKLTITIPLWMWSVSVKDIQAVRYILTVKLRTRFIINRRVSFCTVDSGFFCSKKRTKIYFIFIFKIEIQIKAYQTQPKTSLSFPNLLMTITRGQFKIPKVNIYPFNHSIIFVICMPTSFTQLFLFPFSQAASPNSLMPTACTTVSLRVTLILLLILSPDYTRRFSPKNIKAVYRLWFRNHRLFGCFRYHCHLLHFSFWTMPRLRSSGLGGSWMKMMGWVTTCVNYSLWPITSDAQHLISAADTWFDIWSLFHFMFGLCSSLKRLM